MKLAPVKRLAEKVAAELQPFCTRIAIAGSIRRQRAEVNDIDIVLVPKGLEERRKIVLRCEQTCRRISGEMLTAQNITFRFPAGFQLDLFFAHDGIVDLVSKTPSNWGAVLLCRTGSMYHNQQLCSRAITHGLKFAPYKGAVRITAASHPDPANHDTRVPQSEEIIASKTEEEIYRALGLEYREPTNRESLRS